MEAGFPKSSCGYKELERAAAAVIEPSRRRPIIRSDTRKKSPMAFIRSYRIFQRRAEPGLCCAVPQAMPIPYFVRPDAWSFGRTLSEDGNLPVGFQPMLAREASAAFGYYLFHDPCETPAPRRRRLGGHAGNFLDHGERMRLRA
ncbi:hypothetical protein [Methylobacterium sp. Leaf456]|uniref:hypothetical protein n=1 Tax=Methylobacterium sp. Leaf456 TaxID=1736382 RepID=UPI000B0F2496|nr:hypothetical protein [Methylobacterium sp. Leaf456]